MKACTAAAVQWLRCRACQLNCCLQSATIKLLVQAAAPLECAARLLAAPLIRLLLICQCFHTVQKEEDEEEDEEEASKEDAGDGDKAKPSGGEKEEGEVRESQVPASQQDGM